ncbi:MAG TPA: TetR/AcrR family transcriptional regulator [Turneriella sp.]|nr:TetR/AcrR family transcriptional regulator [Turneriella sp.]HNA80125.1 TetR/AcrR family transcriptional regulator [Turneriella sp.]HNE19366.1 TetR/AcrR family transcriptional regulator [Turneriella sp.]HNJ65295.1 TetR/AcrR family transcriptional regulator [Turneriella sp.]HNL09052.1 TetR/AcrR family transcriptional regulator [Turneriella sp.]
MKPEESKPAWKNYPWKDSRERILVGATVAFSRKGFYGTSVREISYEAGLEQPSIYHHFGNKEKLYWASLRATHLYMIRNLRRQIRDKDTLLGEIRDMFRAVSWFHKEYPEFFSLLFSLVYSSPPTIADQYTSLYGGDIFSFVDQAFRRNPPKTGRLEKYSLTVHTLYAYILSFSGTRPANLHISYYQALRRVFKAL